MKNVKKTLALFLAVTMAVSVFSGCSKNEQKANTTDNSGTTSQSKDPLAKKYEISIATWDLENRVSPNTNDPLYQKFLNKFNITIKPMSTTWDDYIQKIQTWAASDSMPDLSSIDAVGQPFYTTWVKEGIVKQIPKDLSAYPNVKKIMDMPDTTAYRDPDGSYYCIPKPNYADSTLWGLEKGLYIRKDWMKAAGIEKDPENMDEFITMIDKIMKLNPDGVKGLTGVTALNKAHFFQFMLSYAPEVACASNYWVKDESNKWQPGILTSRTKAGLMEMNKLYKANIMDKDIPILKGTEAADKFLAGRAVAFCEGVYKEQDYRTRFAQVNPGKDYDEYVTTIYPWKAANGKIYRNANLSHWSESYIGGKVDDGKLQRILSVYDYVLSEEGLNLMRFGEEGVDYTNDGGKITITRPKLESGEFKPMIDIHPQLSNLKVAFTFDGDVLIKNPETNPKTLQKLNDQLKWYKTNTVPVETDFSTVYMNYEGKENTVGDPTDYMIKVVMSDNPEKEYQKMYNDLMDMGYQKAIDGFNKAAGELGTK